MKNMMQFSFNVDKEQRRILVNREFDAPLPEVWAAWTKPELLDQWWAPKPYKTVTKSMDFRPGGTWFYSMVGPDNDRHWCRADYEAITPEVYYTALDAFTDEHGTVNTDFSRSRWKVDFSGIGDTTLVTVLIAYETTEDLEKIIELGFREGFTMAMGNLDELFAAR